MGGEQRACEFTERKGRRTEGAYVDSSCSSLPLTHCLPPSLSLPSSPSPSLFPLLSFSIFLCASPPPPPPLPFSECCSTHLSLCPSLPFYLPPSRTQALSLPPFLPPSLRVPPSESLPFILVSCLPHSIAAAHTPALRSSPPPACPCVLPRTRQAGSSFANGRGQSVLPKTPQELVGFRV